MKVSIGAYIKEGPWGGGNLFFKNLKIYLESKGHKVINHLLDDDIDIILLTDPRKDSESSSFTDKEITKYKNTLNSKVKIVHRINECDERKGTEGLNKFIYNANKCADATVFVSNWIKNLYFNQGYETNNSSVILSGSNPEIFNSVNSKKLEEEEKLSIVTHHWGGNWNKGFDVYEKLDLMLTDKKFSDLYSFTYIGNVPKNFRFQNSKLVSPLSGMDLASELKKNHVYITASLNEPSGNHHIEAALCGLPILYIDSGALPEYCNGYGIEFNINNLDAKLIDIRKRYFYIKNNLDKYPHKASNMSKEYETLFIDLISKNNADGKKISNLNTIQKLFFSFKRIIILYLYNLLKKNKLWK